MGRLERAAAALPLRTSLLLVFVVFALGFGAFFLRSQLADESWQVNELRLHVLSKQVRRVREFLEQSGLDGATVEMVRQFRARSEDPSLRAALLVSSTGNVLAADPPELVGLGIRDALRRSGHSVALPAALPDARKPGCTRAIIDGSRTIVWSPVQTDGRPVLLAIRSFDDVRAAVRRQVLGEAAALACICLALVAALWTWLELALNRRVRRLVDAAARLAADDLQARARLGGSDELAMAGRAFDEMADSVAQTRMRLLESEERVRLLLDSTAEGLCGLDLSGRITFCNPAALRLLQVARPGQLLGRPFYDLLRLPGSEHPLDKAWVDLALQTHARVDQELALPCADGSVLALQHSGSPVLLQGQLVG